MKNIYRQWFCTKVLGSEARRFERIALVFLYSCRPTFSYDKDWYTLIRTKRNTETLLHLVWINVHQSFCTLYLSASTTQCHILYWNNRNILFFLRKHGWIKYFLKSFFRKYFTPLYCRRWHKFGQRHLLQIALDTTVFSYSVC